jgi:hypothetical protein
VIFLHEFSKIEINLSNGVDDLTNQKTKWELIMESGVELEMIQEVLF